MNTPTAQPAEIRQGINERNISRLNPTLGFNRVSEDMTIWLKRIELDGHGPIDLKCTAGQGLLVPHGIDGDVLFAIQTLWQFRKDPRKQYITTNLAEICKHAGLKPSKNSYERVREALDRLKGAVYLAEACWGREGRKGWRWWSQSFSLIDSIRYSTDLDDIPRGNRDNCFTAETEVVISLGSAIIESINEGHISFLSYRLYEKLGQPLSRLIYRVLAEYRLQGERVAFPLKGWGEHLGLIECFATDRGHPQTRAIRPSLIRRALDPAHKDLVDCGFLAHVEYQGSGRSLMVVYHFGTVELKPIAAADLKLLTQYGITPAVAEQKVRQHGEARVRQVSSTFASMLAHGLKARSKAAYLISMLDNPEKYALEALPEPVTRSTPVPEPEITEPERTASQADVMLGRLVLSSQADQELRQRVIDAFLKGRVTTLELLQLSQTGEKARDKALGLLQRHSV